MTNNDTHSPLALALLIIAILIVAPLAFIHYRACLTGRYDR